MPILVVLAPVAAAAFLSLFGPPGSYARRLRIFCVAVGAFVLVWIAADRMTTDGPSTEGLLHLRHAVTLTEGAEISVPFGLRRSCMSGYDIELHLPGAQRVRRWRPLHDHRTYQTGTPLWDLLVDWTIYRGGRPIAQRTKAPFLLSNYSYHTDDPLVMLGMFESMETGGHEIRLHLKRVPSALRGERAQLLIDSPQSVYKTEDLKAGLRNMLHVCLGLGAAVVLLGGLLAFRGLARPYGVPG